MKKTVPSSRPQRRLVLAYETLRKLDVVDLARVGGGTGGPTGGAIDTTKQGSLNRACTYEQTVCTACHHETDGCSD